MKTIKYLLFCFIPITAWTQDTETIHEDFNGDGYTDALSCYYSGGSGFGGRYCELKNGATNEIYEVNTQGCFCQIKNAILIPPVLGKKENKSFLEAIKKKLLPAWKDSPDPSLQWIINANNSNYELSDNIYFDLIISSPTEWVEGNIELPGTYYIDLKGNALHQLYILDLEPPDWYNQKEYEGWLIYYGHNHYRNPTGDSLTLADSSRSYKAYKTSHGLIIKKEESYAWVFVTDFDLTGGPQKLRWESIKKVRISDNYVIVEQSRAPGETTNIFVIDIETGICGRMKFTSNFPEPFFIENGKLLVEDAGYKKSFMLDEIFNELKVQDKSISK